MPEMKWTDEAIERAISISEEWRKVATTVPQQSYYELLLELKRVRAWVKYGCDDSDTLNGVLNGDPAPGGEQENTNG